MKKDKTCKLNLVKLVKCSFSNINSNGNDNDKQNNNNQFSKSNITFNKDSENISNTNNTNKSNNKYNPELIDNKAKSINIIDSLPEKIQLLLKLGRYDRPIGTLLLFWPCAWGTTLGALTLNITLAKFISMYFVGSMLMRSSGCIINDMWDRNIDKQVERTKERPLASGKITMLEASIFLSLHLSASLYILLQLPYISIISGLAIMPLVCIYPFIKRVTFFPQLILGFCFNSGIVICFPSLTNTINLGICIPFYLGGVLWTLIYDTIYAHMDKEDDKLINVKSTALYFNDNTKKFLMIFLAAIMALFYYSLNKKNKLDNATKSLLVISTFFQVYEIKKVDLNSPLSCLKSFKRNNIFGLLIFLACIANMYDMKGEEAIINH